MQAPDGSVALALAECSLNNVTEEFERVSLWLVGAGFPEVPFSADERDVTAQLHRIETKLVKAINDVHELQALARNVEDLSCD